MRIAAAGLDLEFSEQSIMMWFAMNLASLAGSYFNKKELEPKDFLQSFFLASLCSLVISYFLPKDRNSPKSTTAKSAQFWQNTRPVPGTNLTTNQLASMLKKSASARAKYHH